MLHVSITPKSRQVEGRANSSDLQLGAYVSGIVGEDCQNAAGRQHQPCSVLGFGPFEKRAGQQGHHNVAQVAQMLEVPMVNIFSQ